MCHGEAGGRGGKHCKWLIDNPLELKIRAALLIIVGSANEHAHSSRDSPKRSDAQHPKQGSKNTNPEIITRRVLHALGLRFRLHRRDLPGSPDITLSRHRTLALVHGCFWHQHYGCRLAKTPAARPEYWRPKLRRNVARDEANSADLVRQGWRVVVVWERETFDCGLLTARLRALFGS
jgi:DNA mismatch endonuclease (patch repair protein)